MRRVWLFFALLGLPLGLAQADTVYLNELYVNCPGSDDGFEFVELFGTASDSLTGLTLLAIEGDSTGAGTIDQAISLTGLSLGTNGLHLRRDSATVLTPGPDAGTTVSIGDFAPDLENGSNTYVLVRGFSGSLGQDLDTNNDGILELTPWSSVDDAISMVENDGVSNFGYGAQLGGINFGPHAGFNADVLLRLQGSSQWIGGDVLGSNPGPYGFDSTRFGNPDGSPFDVGELTFSNVSPGGFNPIMAIPEPALAGLLGVVCVAGLVLSRSRRHE